MPYKIKNESIEIKEKNGQQAGNETTETECG